MGNLRTSLIDQREMRRIMRNRAVQWEEKLCSFGENWDLIRRWRMAAREIRDRKRNMRIRVAVTVSKKVSIKGTSGSSKVSSSPEGPAAASEAQ